MGRAVSHITSSRRLGLSSSTAVDFSRQAAPPRIRPAAGQQAADVQQHRIEHGVELGIGGADAEAVFYLLPGG